MTDGHQEARARVKHAQWLLALARIAVPNDRLTAAEQLIDEVLKEWGNEQP